MKIMVTGGAGFLCSAVVKHIINGTCHFLINIDSTYAGNLDLLKGIYCSSRYLFAKLDRCDTQAVSQALSKHQPDVIIHLAGELHVDGSSDSGLEIIQSKTVGTTVPLEAARQYRSNLSSQKRTRFRFRQVSTDEVYGDLDVMDALFEETTPQASSSPYLGSKAGPDDLARAWGRAYGSPIVITNFLNNYGSYHFAEKLTPHVILNRIHG